MNRIPPVLLLLVSLVLLATPTVGADDKQPDLVVTDLKVKPSDGGTKLKIEFKVKNRGKVEAGPVEALVSGPGVDESRQADRLGGGKSKGFQLKVDHPGQPGTVTVTADPNNRVAESDEGNNIATASFEGPAVAAAPAPDVFAGQSNLVLESAGKTPAQADLVLENCSVVWDHSHGDLRLLLAFNIHNQGGADVSQDVPISIQSDTPKYPYNYSIAINPGLRAGELRPHSESLGLFPNKPQDLSVRHLSIRVDPFNLIAEADETNNEVVLTIPRYEMPVIPLHVTPKPNKLAK